MSRFSRKVLFISDLHLHENDPIITQQFTTFVQLATEEAEQLYILGDFFDLWLGDDILSPYQQSIVNLLRTATLLGLKIYFMHGNRDFLLGKTFFTSSGCIPLHEEEKIVLGDMPILLMHGDTLCRQDKNYLRMRKIFQQTFIQKLFLHLPAKWRKAIAYKIQTKSKAYAKTKSEVVMDVTQAAVDEVMDKYAVQLLIHGHTHLPACHQWQYKNTARSRYVLQAWHDGPNALVWNGEGPIEFIKF